MRHTFPRGLAALVILVICAGWSAADTIYIPAAHDNTLYQTPNGDTSNGGGQYFFAGNNGELEARRGLLSFDVAGNLPAGATVTAVTLKLYMSRTISGNQDTALYPLLASWGEGTTVGTGQEGDGAPAQPGDATWLYRFYATQSWGTAGGDFAATASATTAVGSVGYYTWSSAQMAVDVQGWLDNPAANFGWLLHGNENDYATAKRFGTRENTTVEYRPLLQVTFVPEPVLLGGVILLGALTGRRR